MGFIFKMMVPIILLLLVYGYMMKGDKILNFMNNLPEEKAKGVGDISNAVTDEDVTVYQWVDEKGIKHFSNNRPEGRTVDELRMSPKANVIQAIKSPEEKAKPKKAGQVTSISKSPYAPGGGKKLMDKTKGLKDTLDQRGQSQQDLLDQIMGKPGK